MPQQRITVYEDAKEMSFSLDDLMKYHGSFAPAGVAHGFKVMQRAFVLLASQGYLERREVEVDTSFGGPGVRDAFEMVTHAVSREKYNVDEALGAPWARDDGFSVFFFRVRYRDNSVDLILKPGHIGDEFIALAGKSDQTAEDKLRVAELKKEMAEKLMPLAAEDVYALV